jgi:predicted nucleic acid-binding protein
MANNVFLDTNGWLALLNSGDSKHHEADQLWRGLISRGVEVVLTDWIIAETGNGSARSRRRSRFSESAQATLVDPRVNLVIVHQDLLNRSLELFGQYADKSWGLVDCASFIVMRDRSISDAFTSDSHFEQAGFKRLLST